RRSWSVWESEWGKAGILGKACEFHGTRDYEGGSFREKTGFSDQVPGRWGYGTFVPGLLTALDASPRLRSADVKIARWRGLFALENRGDRLDLVARINRQPRADRAAAVERALAGQHLGGHQVSQHRHFHEVFFLRQNIAL